MIKIQNIYYMMAYAFQSLQGSNFQHLETEKFENILDLYAAILSIGIGNQIKRGLGKDYIEVKRQEYSVSGKIHISESIKRNTMIKKQLVYSRDEFVINSYLNQILKTTSMLLIRNKVVNKKYRSDLKQVMLYFDDVDEVNCRTIKWNRISYNRNNLTYKLLVNICYMCIKGILQTEEEGNSALLQYIDSQSLHKLYERFVLKFYQRHYPELNARASQIKWNVFENDDMLPKMQTDITIYKEDKALIIDTKFYGKMLQKHSYGDSGKQHSSNIYQIFTYVKNMDVDHTGNISGLLLYARTASEILPDNSYQIDGSNISVRSLDLNIDFSSIKEQLDLIIKEW
jgi:5-methylcytosine-specific restriction enzyme subunit McrC